MACCFDDLSVALVGFANERCGRLRRSTKLHMAGDQACDPYLRVGVNVSDGIKAIPERRPRITIEKEIVPFDDDDGVTRAQPDAVWAWVINSSVEVRYEDVVCCGSKSSNYARELVSCERLRSALHPPQSTLFKGSVREVKPVHRCDWRSELVCKSRGDRRLAASRRSGQAKQIPSAPRCISAYPVDQGSYCQVERRHAVLGEGHALLREGGMSHSRGSQEVGEGGWEKYPVTGPESVHGHAPAGTTNASPRRMLIEPEL